MPQPELTDTQKLRIIPKIEKQLDRLTKILAGNMDTGEIGLLESTRKIRDDVREIKSEQQNAAKLEDRVRAIEQRHEIIDKQNKRTDSYKVAVFGVAITNIAMIIMWLLGFGR